MPTVTRYWPFGPHGSTGNNLSGIGSQWRELNAAGIPVCYKGADGYGPLFQLMQLSDDYGVDNVGVFRLVTKDGQTFDVPNWNASTPESAAAQHVQKTLAHLPPEFDKRVWLELINEPDKDEDESRPGWGSAQFADWLGKFAQECARLLLPLGYKVAMFGFSSGEPEIPDWTTPGMLEFLRMAGENPDKLAIAVHEYSYNPVSLEDASNPYPWQLGRFEHIFGICDSKGINRPTILVTEFGWTLWNVPPPEVAMPQLKWAAEHIYGPHPQVLMVAIWHFGSGFADIRNKAQRLLEPMKEEAMTWRMEVDKPAPPTQVSFEEQAWAFAEKHRVLEFMPEAALQKKIYAQGFVPVSNEYRQVIDGQTYAGQLAERLNKNEARVFMAKDGDWQNVFYIEELGQVEQPEPPSLPPQEPPPSGNSLDLVPYFVPVIGGNGPLYEVRDNPSGAQRRIQTQAPGDGRHFFIVKGTGGLDGKSEWEELHWDDGYIWRGIDTSPGSNRFYVQYEMGLAMARWCKRFMKIGETYSGPGHRVQFFDKLTCQPSAPNSGYAVNSTTLFAKYPSVTFNGLTFNDVVKLGKLDGEVFWFARGIGMIGWKSAWNESYISELHPPGARPDNIKEPLCHFQLPG